MDFLNIVDGILMDWQRKQKLQNNILVGLIFVFVDCENQLIKEIQKKQFIILLKQQINIAKKFSGSEGTNASHNSIFIVNSLAKTITAMIALKQVSLGKWNFNEPK